MDNIVEDMASELAGAATRSGRPDLAAAVVEAAALRDAEIEASKRIADLLDRNGLVWPIRWMLGVDPDQEVEVEWRDPEPRTQGGQSTFALADETRNWVRDYDAGYLRAANPAFVMHTMEGHEVEPVIRKPDQLDEWYSRNVSDTWAIADEMKIPPEPVVLAGEDLTDVTDNPDLQPYFDALATHTRNMAAIAGMPADYLWPKIPRSPVDDVADEAAGALRRIQERAW
jgi:hypothetical protein